MATLTNASAQWGNQTLNANNNKSLLTKLTSWADTQAPNKTVWFLVSLTAQGVLFLPMPAVLMYYFNAPIVVLAVTLGLFFANIIAGMGGAGIRALIGLLALSVAIHLLLLAVFII